MVVIQFGLVALLGFKPPQFKAGYHIEEAPSVTKATPPSLSQDRLRNLEAILSPKPVLAKTPVAPIALLISLTTSLGPAQTIGLPQSPYVGAS